MDISCASPNIRASISPVLLGAGFSYQSSPLNKTTFWIMVVLALLGALCLQIMSNLVNDYMDFVKGVDDEKRLGPKRVTQAKWVSPFEIKIAIAIAAGGALLLGGVLTWWGGWPLGVITGVSLLCAYLYTGGPYPLGYNGLGDVFAFIFFGPVAVGAWCISCT